MQYEISTPVNSDINTSQKKVQYSLAFSIKRSLLITQQSSTTFRIGSKSRSYLKVRILILILLKCLDRLLKTLTNTGAFAKVDTIELHNEQHELLRTLDVILRNIINVFSLNLRFVYFYYLDLTELQYLLP